MTSDCGHDRPTMPSEHSMAEVLRRRATDTADRLAFQFLLGDGAAGPRLTYGELDAQARRIAAALRQHAGAGERALLLYAPGLEFIPAFFGCLYAGLIAVPAYPPRPDRLWHGVESLARVAEDCQVRVVLTGGDYAEDIRRMCRTVSSLSQAAWLNTSDDLVASGEGWSQQAEDASTVSHLQYTSGSTGTPKGVVIDHGSVMHNEYMIALANGHFETGAAGICGVSWLPFQHDLGLVAGMLQAVYVGGPLVVLSPLTMLQRPFVWLEAISRFRAHTSAGPNFAYDLCVRRLSPEERAALHLSSWSVAGLGAEPVRARTIDGFAAAFASSGFRREAFYPSYGLAEATLMVAGGERLRQPVIVGASAAALKRNEAVVRGLEAENVGDVRPLVGCGHAWLDQRIMIVDPNTRQPCPTGQVGEIWVCGPSVAKGYWQRPDETQHTFHARLSDTDEGPFLRTGDFGFFHAGELFITGRLKDVLIVRGQNHYPQDIESTVQGLDPAFRADAGAVFQAERDGIERLVIVQEVSRPPKHFDSTAVARRVRQTIAERHGIEVDEVLFVRSVTLPKTTSGKIQRHACRAAYESGQLVHWQPNEH